LKLLDKIMQMFRRKDEPAASTLSEQADLWHALHTRDHPDEILPGLWLGSYTDMWMLVRANPQIKVLCVADEFQDRLPNGAYFMPIWEDKLWPSVVSIGVLNAASELIDFWMTRGEKVIVHCAMGVERSALTMAWYLHKKHGMKLRDAYAYLREKRPVVAERYEWLPGGTSPEQFLMPTTVANIDWETMEEEPDPLTLEEQMALDETEKNQYGPTVQKTTFGPDGQTFSEIWEPVKSIAQSQLPAPSEPVPIWEGVGIWKKEELDE
jgi:protein-tyrosine phosphatase